MRIAMRLTVGFALQSTFQSLIQFRSQSAQRCLNGNWRSTRNLFSQFERFRHHLILAAKKETNLRSQAAAPNSVTKPHNTKSDPHFLGLDTRHKLTSQQQKRRVLGSKQSWKKVGAAKSGMYADAREINSQFSLIADNSQITRHCKHKTWVRK
jgi:hypothetical protein